MPKTYLWGSILSLLAAGAAGCASYKQGLEGKTLGAGSTGDDSATVQAEAQLAAPPATTPSSNQAAATAKTQFSLSLADASDLLPVTSSPTVEIQLAASNGGPSPLKLRQDYQANGIYSLDAAPGTYNATATIADDEGALFSGTLSVTITSQATTVAIGRFGDPGSGKLALEMHDPLYDPFTEIYGGGQGMRFQTRGLKLNGLGPAISIKSGGAVTASLDIDQACTDCGGAANQILVGLGGQDQAQACIWSGGASSDVWQTTAFTLNVPTTPGTYYVRTRYAQGTSCGDGIGWWQVDRAQGPTAASTIGIVVVEP